MVCWRYSPISFARSQIFILIWFSTNLENCKIFSTLSSSRKTLNATESIRKPRKMIFWDGIKFDFSSFIIKPKDSQELLYHASVLQIWLKISVLIQRIINIEKRTYSKASDMGKIYFHITLVNTRVAEEIPKGRNWKA